MRAVEILIALVLAIAKLEKAGQKLTGLWFSGEI